MPINDVDWFFFNRKDRQDRKDKNVGFLAAEKLDSVIHGDEVARHIVHTADAIHTAHDPA